MRVRGSYALAFMFKIAGRALCHAQGQPLIIGVDGTDTYVASDVGAFKYTGMYTTSAISRSPAGAGSATFYNIDQEIEKEVTQIKWDAESAEKGGFDIS